MTKHILLCGAALFAAISFTTPTFANSHGCDRFANSDLSEAQVRQLRGAGHCDSPRAHAGGRVKLVTRTHTRTRMLERGVSDGSNHAKDNLTSMGRAESDGTHVMRVRSSKSQEVSLRHVGGETKTISVDAGDTIVEVDGGGTYVAEFKDTGTKKTKSTGSHTWDDVKEETVTTQERVEVESGDDSR
ncbi:MAG: hypothetical protein AAF771_01575 [Pseudomonadota bacterium]